jgi:hypothetical protein
MLRLLKGTMTRLLLKRSRMSPNRRRNKLHDSILLEGFSNINRRIDNFPHLASPRKDRRAVGTKGDALYYAKTGPSRYEYPTTKTPRLD